MPAFCHTFHMQPSEFRALKVRELDMFVDFIARLKEASA